MSGKRLAILAPALLDSLARRSGGQGAAVLRCAALLARGERSSAPAMDDDALLLAQCGLAAAPGSAGLPVAGLTAALDFALASTPDDSLRADPVYLRADPSRTILFDADSVGLDAEEADSLLAELNAAFEADGIRFSRGLSATRWYLQMAGAQDAGLPSPQALRGSTVEACLGQLRRAGAMNRLLTEVQMVLHGAAVNVARAAQGRPPLNSVWFWGGGALVRGATQPPDLIIGGDDLAAACARHLGITHARETTALASTLAAPGPARLLLVLNDLTIDLPSFVADILEPAWRALKGGQLVHLDIHTRTGTLSLPRAARWRWWRSGTAFLRYSVDDTRKQD